MKKKRDTDVYFYADTDEVINDFNCDEKSSLQKV